MKTDFLAIDELRLDQECIKQPQLYFTYAQQAADARRELDECKSVLDVASAELSKEIRKNPTKYGLNDKPTEASINSTISLQKRYREAHDAIVDASHRVAVLGAAVTALEHRKRALTLLVNLKGQEFYSEPKVSEKGKTAVSESVKAHTRKLGQRKTTREDDVEDDE